MSWKITVTVPHAKPVFDRSRSGLRRAGGSILPPGSYDFKVGDTYYVECVVTSETEGKIKTVVLINGEIANSWEDEIGPGITVSHTHTDMFIEEGTYEISMAVYYWDGSQYVKSDEYGC